MSNVETVQAAYEAFGRFDISWSEPPMPTPIFRQAQLPR
jgi:hypothetical protein